MNLRIEVVNLHVHLELSQSATEKLDQILAQGVAMSAALDKITSEVADTKSVIASAVTLINGLAQQIRDLSTDPVALNALADDLDASSKSLADAVAANTPAAPPTV